MHLEINQADDEYSRQFSEPKFWDKLLSYAKSSGSEVVERALQLYFAMQNPQTPAWAKGVIIAALGYFIAPVDAIADIVPGVGYSDDLGVLWLALAAVAMYVTPEVKENARAKLKEWFG